MLVAKTEKSTQQMDLLWCVCVWCENVCAFVKEENGCERESLGTLALRDIYYGLKTFVKYAFSPL